MVPVEITKCAHKPGKKFIRTFSSSLSLNQLFNEIHGTSSKWNIKTNQSTNTFIFLYNLKNVRYHFKHNCSLVSKRLGQKIIIKKKSLPTDPNFFQHESGNKLMYFYKPNHPVCTLTWPWLPILQTIAHKAPIIKS